MKHEIMLTSVDYGIKVHISTDKIIFKIRGVEDDIS